MSRRARPCQQRHEEGALECVAIMRPAKLQESSPTLLFLHVRQPSAYCPTDKDLSRPPSSHELDGYPSRNGPRTRPEESV